MTKYTAILKTNGSEYRVKVIDEDRRNLDKSGVIYTLFDDVDFIFKSQNKAYQYANNINLENLDRPPILMIDWFSESIYDEFLKVNWERETLPS